MTAITLSAALLYACNTGENTGTTNDNPAAPATAEAPALPAFQLTDMAGKTVNLEAFKGKMVFVNLWAAWCMPCRAEMPSIQQLYEKTKGKNVEFVMLSLDEDFNKSKDYFNSAGFSLPAYTPAAPLPALFNVPGIPATFIFNTKGELVKTVEGGDNYDTNAWLTLLSGG